jgi:hypothetical protein
MSHQRKIYHSENGDSWWLCRDEDGRVFVLHEASRSCGGKVTRLEIGEFFGAGSAGPQHQALIRLIGQLASLDDAAATCPAEATVSPGA